MGSGAPKARQAHPDLLVDSLACNCNDDTGVGSPANQVKRQLCCTSLCLHEVRPLACDSWCCIRHPRVFADHANLRSKIRCVIVIQPRKTTQHTDSPHTCRDRHHQPRAGWASQNPDSLQAATCRISGRTHPTYTVFRNRERPLRPDIYLLMVFPMRFAVSPGTFHLALRVCPTHVRSCARCPRSMLHPAGPIQST